MHAEADWILQDTFWRHFVASAGSQQNNGQKTVNSQCGMCMGNVHGQFFFKGIAHIACQAVNERFCSPHCLWFSNMCQFGKPQPWEIVIKVTGTTSSGSPMIWGQQCHLWARALWQVYWNLWQKKGYQLWPKPSMWEKPGQTCWNLFACMGLFLWSLQWWAWMAIAKASYLPTSWHICKVLSIKVVLSSNTLQLCTRRYHLQPTSHGGYWYTQMNSFLAKKTCGFACWSKDQPPCPPLQLVFPKWSNYCWNGCSKALFATPRRAAFEMWWTKVEALLQLGWLHPRWSSPKGCLVPQARQWLQAMQFVLKHFCGERVGGWRRACEGVGTTHKTERLCFGKWYWHCAILGKDGCQSCPWKQNQIQAMAASMWDIFVTTCIDGKFCPEKHVFAETSNRLWLWLDACTLFSRSS